MSTRKTAISMDDGLLKEVDEAARQLGLSREEQMLARLNEVYAGAPDEADKRLVSQFKTKFRLIDQ